MHEAENECGPVGARPPGIGIVERIRIIRGWMCFGLVVASVLVSVLLFATRYRRVVSRFHIRNLLWAFDVKVKTHGINVHAWHGRPAMLLATNHVLWLDPFLIIALTGARALANSVARSVPVLGYIVERARIILIDNSKRRTVLHAIQSVTAALREGDDVIVFPEGKLSDGISISRFHANLFQAAIDAGVSVQPVALRYTNGNGHPSPLMRKAYQRSLFEAMTLTLREPALTAEIFFLTPIESTGRSRAELAAATAAAIDACHCYHDHESMVWRAGTMPETAVPLSDPTDHAGAGSLADANARRADHA